MQESSKEREVDYQQVGIRIKELRKSHHFSQKAFAELLNISQGHLSRVEKGSVISAALCSLIAEKFNTSMEYLLTGQEQKALDATPPVPPVAKAKPAAFPSISLDQSDSIAASNKKIKKLLEDCRYEYSFTVDEIRDVDSVLETDEQLYPATSYTFSLDVECIPTGYYWVATEVARSEGSLDELLESHTERERKKRLEAQGRPYTPSKTAKDSCVFVPYSFRMFSPYDFLAMDVEGPGDIGRYRQAKEIALFNNLEMPEDILDPIIDDLAPDPHEYEDDGTIDRKAEFERFKKLIRTGVGGKSLTPSSVRACDGDYFTSGGGVVYKGRRYSLNCYGRLGITVGSQEFADSEMQFIIDDKLISAEQFLDMLTAYEGWQLSFKIESI